LEAIRLVVIQGPLNSLVASAAIAHAERQSPSGLRHVMLFGQTHAHDAAQLRAASVSCGAAIEWDRVLSGDGMREPRQLREAVGAGVRVAELWCMRNWQDLNELALRTFPDAYRVAYGDGLGVLDLKADSPYRFHAARLAIPQPETRHSLDGVDLDVVPREALLDTIEKVRAADPALRELDSGLAEFARGGVLVLPSWFTETGIATLRGEARQSRVSLEPFTRDPGSPILIKPHPRASAGQAALLARLLRRSGHQVRLISRRHGGRYPIELFSELATSVGCVQGLASSGAISLHYLYGSRVAVGAPASLILRTTNPREARPLIGACKYYESTLERLDRWDGASPMPPWPNLRPALPDKILGRIVRPWSWRPLRARRRDFEVSGPQPLPPALAGHVTARAAAPVWDPLSLATWWLVDGGARSAVLEALESAGPAPSSRLLAASAAAPRAAGGGAVVTVVAVAPPSHRPLWRVWLARRVGIAAPAGAELSAADVEDLLESELDVVARVPEPADFTHRGAPARGHVAFAARPRKDSRSA
jgi:hypothetical protein